MVTPPKVQPQFVFGSSNQHGSPLAQGATYDLTSSDPALGVIIKGLQKRDAVTRARASDELLSYLQDGAGLSQEAAKNFFIKSWIGLYGSLAIDIDRKVRANSHAILGHLVQEYQKKTVKFLPQVAALWLVGQHDSDRSVSRAALESFESAFPSEAKRVEFMRIFADSIYDKCYDLVMVADAASLSDARFVNSEDSQAKFNNVVGGAQQVIATLISTSVLDTSRQTVLLDDARLWKRLSTEDALLQRHGLRLLKNLLNDNILKDCHDSIQLHLGHLLPRILISNSSDLTDILLTIASYQSASLYMSKDSSKKAIPKRFRKFIQQSTGPGLPESYWNKMARLLELATGCLEPNGDEIAGLIDALDKSSRQATRLQAGTAIAAFNQVCVVYIIAGSTHAKAKFVERFSTELSNKGVLSAYAVPLQSLYTNDPEMVISILRSFSDQVSGTFSTEDRTELDISYQWADVMAQLSVEYTHSDTAILQLQRDVISSALNTKHASPNRYNFICKTFRDLNLSTLLSDPPFTHTVQTFTQNLPVQAFHNSENTLALLDRLVHMDAIPFGATEIIASLLEKDASHEDAALGLVRTLLDNYFDERSTPFQTWIASDLKIARKTEDLRWNIYMSYLRSREFDACFVDTIQGLASIVLEDESQGRAADLLELIVIRASHADSVEALDDVSLRNLVTSPWTIFNCATTTSIAAALRSFLKSESPRMVTATRMEFSEKIIEVHENSAKIRPLCLAAVELGEEMDLVTDTLLTHWNAVLFEVLPIVMPQELAILHPIGILSQFVKNENDQSQIKYDSEGHSALARVVLVLAGLRNRLSMSTAFDVLIGMQLVMVKSQHEEANRVVSSQARATELSSFLISGLQSLVSHMADALQSTTKSTMADMVDLARHDDKSPLAYYKALAFYEIACCVRERGTSIERAGEMFQICSNDLFLYTSFSSAFNEALLSEKKATFQRNKLASDLSGKMKAERILESLVKLNALLPQESQPTEIMPRQRIIFLMKALLDYRQEQPLPSPVLQQLLTLISRVIPSISKEYGSFWKAIIDWVVEVMQGQLQSTLDLSLVYTNLKLVAWLTANYESNDDLSEFWLNSRKQCEPLIAKTFIKCSLAATGDQASILCTLIASRLARAVPAASLDDQDKTELSALICSDIEHIQLSVYALHIPASEQEREEMVMRSALAKEFDDIEVELPAELLSVVVECPAEDEDSIYDSPSPMPAGLRGYCMAWLLLFKFFEQSPMRMRLKLVDDLQRLDLIESLLGFVFLALKLPDTKPVDVSKISKSELDVTFDNGQGELISYASHLYYLALVHTPALVRTWWIDCKDRLLSAAVENLTEKHYSILLIQRDVQTLSGKQSADVLKDDNLTINVSNAGRDIFTTYEIDEQKMEMAIRLPSNYPLRRVVVEGLQRIGVKDAQWRAWLLASQAVLTAQNGTILDAISLFQRNVSLHFEGVADCNICFSVLSVTDKSLPSKKCQTCKNLFHSSCLFKWFKSSSQSRCPLCRTSFAF